MQERYLVVQTDIDSEYSNDFATLEEANQYADMQWHHLTWKEKQVWKVFVVKVTEEEMRRETEQGLIPEEDWDDGVIPWCVPSSYDYAEGGFNSEEVLREEIAKRYEVDTD